MAEFITAMQAAKLMHDSETLAIGGFGGWLGADLLFAAVRDRYMEEGHPRDLRLFSGILPGNLQDDDVGANLLAVDGLVTQVTAAHMGMPPKIGRMAAENRLAAFSLPLGVVGDLLRAAAGRKPAVITKVGLGTFCDPRLDGCAMNRSASEKNTPLAAVETIGGEEYLRYTPMKLDACLLRAATADEDGNISGDRDPMIAEQMEMALAVKANGGKVIVQVDRLVPAGSIPAKSVLLHRGLVDYIVVDEDRQCAPGYDCPEFRPELCGGEKQPVTHSAAMNMGARKICGRRGALELQKGCVINLGIGIPDGVAAVAAEEGIAEYVTLSVESGPLGGVPVGGVGFGASANPEAIYRLCDNFDFYDGGGLNMAFLGAGEIDRFGNVNVSRFGKKVTGPGGFINIVQNTPVVCFMGTFTAGGLETTVENGKLRIVQEGKTKKFCEQVQQVTFSGPYAAKSGQKILYITERAVFRLTESGLELIEIAPGIDLEREVLAQMDFVPRISDRLKEMDARIFAVEPMGLS